MLRLLHRYSLITSLYSLYIIDFENGNRSGRGVTCYCNGNVHEGLYQEDLPNGEGNLLFAGGGLFHGEFSHGKENGRGVMTLSDGSFLRGYWVNGIFRDSNG